MELIVKSEYMRLALTQARLAAAMDEVPVGAVVVKNGSVIAAAHNLTNSKRDASCHAELLALRQAAEAIGDWRLNDCVLYVTLEPCAMCAGACVNFHIGALAFGAFDKKAGAICSAAALTSGALCGFKLPYVGGIIEQECSYLLTEYFTNKRNAGYNNE